MVPLVGSVRLVGWAALVGLVDLRSVLWVHLGQEAKVAHQVDSVAQAKVVVGSAGLAVVGWGSAALAMVAVAATGWVAGAGLGSVALVGRVGLGWVGWAAVVVVG